MGVNREQGGLVHPAVVRIVYRAQVADGSPELEDDGGS